MAKLKILIVDDDEDVLESTAIVVNSLGYDTVKAKNGKEAVSKYEQFLPDVVLMDIVMPIMDGVQAFYEIIKKHATAKIILLTGYNFTGKAKQALKDGAVGLLEKPMDIEKLKHIIREIS